MSNAPSKPVSFSRPKVGYVSNRPRMCVCGVCVCVWGVCMVCVCVCVVCVCVYVVCVCCVCLWCVACGVCVYLVLKYDITSIDKINQIAEDQSVSTFRS